jgi:coenzyme Q-binding protein COQ10
VPTHSIERVLPYAPQQCYDLVADVESYPRFLPWCEGARIAERVSPTVVLADLVIHFRGVQGKYTSRVQLNPAAKEIHVELAQGPFKHLHQAWAFLSVDNGKQTRVEFDIDFALRSFLLEKMADMMFDKACAKMMDAFIREAEKRYGRG